MHYRITALGTTPTFADFSVLLLNVYPTHTETVTNVQFRVQTDHVLIDNEPEELCMARLKELGYDVEGRA